MKDKHVTQLVEYLHFRVTNKSFQSCTLKLEYLWRFLNCCWRRVQTIRRCGHVRAHFSTPHSGGREPCWDNNDDTHAHTRLPMIYNRVREHTSVGSCPLSNITRKYVERRLPLRNIKKMRLIVCRQFLHGGYLPQNENEVKLYNEIEIKSINLW